MNPLRGFRWIGAILWLAGCTGPADHTVPNRQELVNKTADNFRDLPALRRVPINSNLFHSKSVQPDMPPAVAANKIDLRFPMEQVKLSDLLVMLDYQGIPVMIRPPRQTGGGGDGAAASTGDNIGDRLVPFRRFNGTLGELTDLLRTAMDVAVWWESGNLMLDAKDRYVVSVPQHEPVIDAVTTELEEMGAEAVTPSLYGGQIVYRASPELNDNIIKPYLRRLASNLAEITLQVASVSVTLNDDDTRGFDWSAFNLDYNARRGATPPGTNSGTQGLITGNRGTFDLDREFLFFGRRTVFGLAGAFDYLSTLGKTTTEQMVELRTLAGIPVALRNGEEIPYVKSLSNTTTGGTGSSAVTGSVETDTVETGLTLELTPHFDSAVGLVVIDVTIDVSELVRFVNLSAGNQVGTLSQPQTATRNLTDIVRVPAGETIILGGIRTNSRTDERSAPFGAFDIGRRVEDESSTLTFYIIRPVVTLYNLEDSTANPETATDATQREIPANPSPLVDAMTEPMLLPTGTNDAPTPPALPVTPASQPAMPAIPAPQPMNSQPSPYPILNGQQSPISLQPPNMRSIGNNFGNSGMLPRVVGAP